MIWKTRTKCQTRIKRNHPERKESLESEQWLTEPWFERNRLRLIQSASAIGEKESEKALVTRFTWNLSTNWKPREREEKERDACWEGEQQTSARGSAETSVAVASPGSASSFTCGIWLVEMMDDSIRKKRNGEMDDGKARLCFFFEEEEWGAWGHDGETIELRDWLVSVLGRGKGEHNATVGVGFFPGFPVFGLFTGIKSTEMWQM